MKAMKAKQGVMPAVAAPAALSFLKETKGMLTWTTKEFARGLGIKATEAGPALAIRQMQGYIKPAEGRNVWMTTLDGDSVSGATLPRFSADTVKQALADLSARIRASNRDTSSEFRIAAAVAIGDFLSERRRVQAANVGIELIRRKVSRTERRVPEGQEAGFLEALRDGEKKIRIVAFEPWMRHRTHLQLD